MPLLSSHLLIQTSSLTLVGLAYLLLTSPLTVLQSTSIDLLGSSMHITPASFVPVPEAAGFSNPLAAIQRQTLPTASRELLALLSLVLFLAAVSQSALASGLSYSRDGLMLTSDGKRKDTQAVGEEIRALHASQTQWMTLAGSRVVVTGTLVGWIYVGYSQRNLLNSSVGGSKREVSSLGLLANRITFAIGMSDMLFWGYLWTVLREEMRQIAEMVARRRAQDEEDDINTR